MYHLRGQLGNQLFEYATAIGAGARAGHEPLHYYNPAHGANTAWLNHLRTDSFLPASSWEAFRAGGWVPRRADLLIARAFYKLAYAPLWRRRRHLNLVQRAQSPFASDPAFFDGHYRSVEGYFQHPSYFTEGVDQVLSALSETLQERRLLPPLVDDSIAVHARGRDYADFGWTLDASYYVTTARLLPSDASGLGFTIFSDDPSRALDVCRALAEAGFRARVSPTASTGGDIDPIDSAFRDLGLLGAHRHLVMSNSTFCWWAAALGDLRFREEPRSVMVPWPWEPTGEARIARKTWRASPASFIGNASSET